MMGNTRLCCVIRLVDVNSLNWTTRSSTLLSLARSLAADSVVKDENFRSTGTINCLVLEASKDVVKHTHPLGAAQSRDSTEP